MIPSAGHRSWVHLQERSVRHVAQGTGADEGCHFKSIGRIDRTELFGINERVSLMADLCPVPRFKRLPSVIDAISEKGQGPSFKKGIGAVVVEMQVVGYQRANLSGEYRLISPCSPGIDCRTWPAQPQRHYQRTFPTAVRRGDL